MSKKITQADLAAANALGQRLAEARSLSAAPASALLMKDANDFHELLRHAAQDTHALLEKIDDDGLSVDEWNALRDYEAQLVALEARAAAAYARALAAHVGCAPPLVKIAEHMASLEKRLSDALAPAPTSPVIEIAK